MNTTSTFTILWCSLLALLLAGYLAQQYLPPPTPRMVGIDLGTTYSCVGVYEAVTGRISIIPLGVHGDKRLTIPSIVHFGEKRISTGYEAVRRAKDDPSNAIYDSKRFIGKIFDEEGLRKAANSYPFKVVLGENGMANFKVLPHTESRGLVTPEFVASRLIAILKSSAEANLSVLIDKAVMAVPAEFDERQRNFTKAAAKLAGVQVLRIINEPTAAALAYGLHVKDNVTNVMVIDLGGGTSDVSILNVQHGMFLTRAIAGNNYLGGQDFNERLFGHLEKVIESATDGRQLTKIEEVHALKQAVEEVKLGLTRETWFPIEVQLPSLDYVLRRNVTRQTFEDVNEDLFAKVTVLLDTVLREAEMSVDGIDEVVLVGGSTRIPRLRKLIADYFGKVPNMSLDPELAVAHGVAIQAGIIGGMWPLQVSAIEIPTKLRKIHLQ